MKGKYCEGLAPSLVCKGAGWRRTDAASSSKSCLALHCREAARKKKASRRKDSDRFLFRPESLPRRLRTFVNVPLLFAVKNESHSACGPARRDDQCLILKPKLNFNEPFSSKAAEGVASLTTSPLRKSSTSKTRKHFPGRGPEHGASG